MKRYYTFSRFLREKFGCPVYKIPVNAGFSCPNRDGAISYGGCSFCYNPSFSPVAEETCLSVREQVERGREAAIRKGRRKAKFMAYLQSYTNTYGSVEQLRRVYDEALSVPDIVGLSIGTRPDCVPGPVLDLVASYAQRYHIWLEYGLQSSHDRTLRRINRGHSFADFVDAVERTRNRGIYVCAHVIIGLPGEDRRDYVETALRLSELGVDGVKIHHLQVVEHTRLAREYREGTVPTLSLEEYVPLVCNFLEHLDPGITVHRLCGEVLDGDLLLAPRWRVTKAEVIQAIDRELERRNTRQGARISC
ncbi:MAG: TIGR01212 family radical SAM protein [Bacillota bacterium]